MNLFKKIWPYLLALACFVLVAGIYMYPSLEGKLIAANDGLQWRGAVHEAEEYSANTGDYSFWTGSMFSGMPNYQIGGGLIPSDILINPIRLILVTGHRNVFAIVLIYCIGFFALVRSMKVDKWLAIVGALAITFSSYFFIIIAANHHTKTSTLALISMALAGFYLIFHGHRKTGIILTMLGTMAGFYPHPQMAYYLFFIFAAFGIAELCIAWKKKEMKTFFLNALLVLIGLGTGVGTGIGKTFSNLEYAKETMRGGHSDLEKTSDTDNKTEGLDLDYATAWSYGIDECWTFLIPNYMGGSSNYNLGSDSEFCKTLIRKGVPRSQAQQISASAPTYWGDQPFTAGPVYMGALVCLLFILSLFVVKGPYKWALLAVTLLSIILSWGHNWMAPTRFFFEYMPMYNKFRAVSSILVIAEITMPLMGFLALQRIVDAKKNGLSCAKEILMAGGVTVVLLFVALATTSGFSGAVDQQLPEWLAALLQDTRKDMFRSDLWRSMGFVLAGTALLYFYTQSKKFNSTALLAVALGALVLLDMWPVDKRFMNGSHFVSPTYIDRHFRETAWEKQILRDTDPSYRVFNLTVSPFNDARTSYRLKSIGGYSAAKLRRYQDLIDEHLSKMHQPVIDMLNTRYFIVPDRNNNNAPVVQYNPGAMGNAWFVDNLKVVETPNEESDGLMEVDLHQTAIVGKDFAQYAEDHIVNQHDSAATVRLDSYSPKELNYTCSNQYPGTLVFSEIYYPYGWKASIDGKEAEHYRVNYMLRALNVPAGQHQVRFVFDPDSVRKGSNLAMIFIIIMYATILGCLIKGIYDWVKRPANSDLQS
ncbi:MAG: YfhO family protein [Bacteroidales bacterium]|nr:YfhO family protein [Bacteroidales bacterium]